MAESSSRGLLPRKKPRSDVQEYFEAVHGEKKVKCLLCNPHKEIVFHGGTTNLREHLTSQHTFDYSTTQQSKPLSLTLSKRSCCSEARSKEIMELIVEMVVVDMHPLCMVECEGFFESEEVS